MELDSSNDACSYRIEKKMYLIWSKIITCPFKGLQHVLFHILLFQIGNFKAYFDVKIPLISCKILASIQSCDWFHFKQSLNFERKTWTEKWYLNCILLTWSMTRAISCSFQMIFKVWLQLYRVIQTKKNWHYFGDLFLGLSISNKRLIC